MVIKNDISGINNARMLQTTNKAQAKTMEKLASGYKINRSADDAASLSISEKMMKQIQSLNKAIDNSSDGMSMANVADGAMDEVGGMLQRLNELALQGSNGTLSADDRANINAEASQLLSDIDRVSGSTKFNEIHLMNGEGADIQAGADNAGSNRITVSSQPVNTNTLGIGSVNLGSAESSRAALNPIADAIKSLTDQRAGIGATYNRMSATSRNLANVTENTNAANSRIRDTDMASEIMKKKNRDVLAKSNLAMMQKNNEERATRANALQNFQLH